MSGDPRPSTRLSRILLAAIFVGAAGWYSPFITAAAWHIFHPRGWVSYQGLQMRVPWPWISDEQAINENPSVMPEGVALKKMPFSMSRHLPPETAFVTVISLDPGKTPDQQEKGWMDIFRATHPTSTFSVQTPVALPPEANCLRAQNSSTPKDVVWTCISVKHGWVASFEGQAADERAFFDMVSELKSEN